MKPPLSYVPLLPASISFAAGIVLFRHIEWWYLLIPLAMAITAIILKWRIVALPLMFLSLGGIDMALSIPTKPATYGYGLFSGVVEEWGEGDNTRTLLIKINSVTDSFGNHIQSTPFICQAVTPSMLPTVNYGDIVTFEGRLTPPDTSTDLPDEFDMADYYFSRGITAYTFLPPGDLRIVGMENGLAIILSRWRSRLSDMVMQSRLDDPTSSFLCAMMFGEKRQISPETRLTFSSAGLAHALALSGMHVAIIAMIASIALFPLTLLSHRRLSSLIIVVILWIYAIMTGCSPPTIRAVIMATLVIGSYLLQRSHSSGNALCAAAIIILIIWPKALFEVGFQLSFMAVASILLFSDWVNRLGIRSWPLRNAVSLIGVPVSAVIGTTVPMLFYFHSFPVYFLLANIPVTFLLPLFMSGGIAVLLCEALAAATPEWMTAAVDALYRAIDSVAHIVAIMPGASVTGIYISWATALSACLALTFAGCWYCFKRRIWGYLSLSASFMAVAMALAIKSDFPENEYFLTRNKFHTDIIVRHNETAWLITTAAEADYEDLLNRANYRYRDYLGKRRLPPLKLAAAPVELRLGNDRWVVLHDDRLHSISAKPDYLLICRGFSGDAVETAHAISPDTVVLSSDLHPRRRRRYINNLKLAGVPTKSLADGPIRRIYNHPSTSFANGMVK